MTIFFLFLYLFLTGIFVTLNSVGGAILITVLFILGFKLFAEVNLLTILSWEELVWYSLVYIIIGIIYSTYRFTLCLKKARKQYYFDLDRNVGKGKLYLSKKDYFAHLTDYAIAEYTPTFKGFKDEISTWLLFWPLSVVIYLFEDIIGKFATWVVNSIKSIYIKFREVILKDVLEDIKENKGK